MSGSRFRPQNVGIYRSSLDKPMRFVKQWIPPEMIIIHKLLRMCYPNTGARALKLSMLKFGGSRLFWWKSESVSYFELINKHEV